MTFNSTSKSRALVWFRTDLRTQDNPAFFHACSEHEQVIGLYDCTPLQWDKHQVGDNKRWFITECVTALKQELENFNVPLITKVGTDYSHSINQVISLCAQFGITDVYLNRELEINEQHRDQQLKKACFESGINCFIFNDQTLLEPGSVLTGSKDYYRVFTPFKNAVLKRLQATSIEPLGAPSAAQPLPLKLQLQAKQVTEALPKTAKTCTYSWVAGEKEAHKRLSEFMESRIQDYDAMRDLPLVDMTSRLSPYLAAGCLSSRQCYKAAEDVDQLLGGDNQGVRTWANEIIWREFYRHILIGFPGVCKGEAFNPSYSSIPWRKAPKDFNAWCQGETGYPIVDAAMKQLVNEGWMHNRLRMVTAMFLTKHLLIDWRLGELFFMEHLIDADFSANNGGWQWSASTGADAAPYFRIFNPTRQSQRFDADGKFIKKYLPQLADLSTKSIHQPTPFEAQAAGYQLPIVEHKFATDRAKQTFKSALSETPSTMEHAV